MGSGTLQTFLDAVEQEISFVGLQDDVAGKVSVRAGILPEYQITAEYGPHIIKLLKPW